MLRKGAEMLKQLFNGKWVRLVYWNNYEFLDEPPIVMVIPIRTDTGEPLVGFREEYCPPYFFDREDPDQMDEEMYYTVITGRIEEGDSAEETLYREIEEEAGIRMKPEATIVPLSDSIPLVKFASTRVYPYLVYLEEGTYDFVEAKGDGTENEARSQTLWAPVDKISQLVEETTNFDFSFLFLKYVIEYLKR